MKKNDWIKTGVKCKWNDPAINDYAKKDRKHILNRVFEIVDISDDVIEEDTIISIEEEGGGSFAEVYADELKPLR